jgi:hypothetical protein
MSRSFGRFLRQNTIALIALFIALGGTTFAAANALPRNSVGTKQLKNNAVTSPKIKNNQVTGADVRESSLGTVPSATNASHATSDDSATNATNATNATSATNAGNANTVGGYAASSLSRADEGTTIGFVDTAITAGFPAFQDVGDVTVNAPAAGYVLVTGQAPIYRRGTGTCSPSFCRAVARLHDLTGDVATLHSIVEIDDSSRGAATISVSWVFHIPAGSRTFALEVAFADGATSGALGVFDTSLNAVYSPFNLSGTPGSPTRQLPAHPPTTSTP